MANLSNINKNIETYKWRTKNFVINEGSLKALLKTFTC